MLSIGCEIITVTIHAAYNYRYILNNDISLIYSNTFTHKMSRRNASNIDLFLTKDISYNSTCYSENDLSSNHLPVILNFDRVNIAKNELMLHKTDWSEFFNRTDKWRVDYRSLSLNSIDYTIEKLQKFILNAYKQSSTYQRRKKFELVTDGDNRAAIDKNYYRRKFQRTGNNRYRVFRNILNKHVKAALIEARNNYWANKLKLQINTKDNSLEYFKILT